MYCQYCGKEINDQADVCLGCGCAVRTRQKSTERDSNSVGWWWLGFFFPLVGLVLWIVWGGDTPIRAKRIGWGALVGVIVSVALVVLIYAAIFAFTFMVGMNVANNMYI